MKCIWRTSMDACMKEEGKTTKCRPLLCPDGYQVKLVLALAFIFIIVIMVLSV